MAGIFYFSDILILHMNGALAASDTIFNKVVLYLFNPLYQILVVVAFLYFLFGVAFLMFQLNNPEKREIARRHLLYGVIGLFIILSVGAIIKFINELVGGGLQY